MRGICGWFAARPESDGVQVLQSMLAHGKPPLVDVQSKLTPPFAVATFGTTGAPVLHESDGFVLALFGRPRLVQGERRTSEPAELAHVLRTRGKEALNQIVGDFVLAAWDGKAERGLLAVDRIGVHQLVYARTGDSLVFASSLDILGGHPGVRRQLRLQGIFDYLYYHVSPGPGTVLDGLHRIPPGHCFEFGAGTPAQPAPYWSIRFDEQHDAHPERLEEEFLTLLQSAVGETSEGAVCGTFLSGGTDSSTISGMLGRVSERPTRAFSIGFDVAGYDEMEYARIAAGHFGCEHHEYYVTPADVVRVLPSIAAAYDQPFGNASAVPTYYCAKVAREHGVTRLLAGDGGDELFGGNERYAKQHLLGHYQRIPAALRRSLIEPLLRSAPLVSSVAPLRKLRSYVEQAAPPMPQRYESYNLLLHLGMSAVFTPDFLASVDRNHPERLLAQAHAPHANASLINQMLAIDLRFILADGDLPKVTRMCELAQVEVAFPILDDRVVAFSQRLAANLKLRGTELRWFFKHALRDFLPPAVLAKKKHGFGLPVGAWLVEHKPLHDLARDSIASLRPRGIVQPQFIDQLLDARLREHPAYFGTMVWVLMMLGLWLDSRGL